MIELISDIGGGKTTFVKGLAIGIHSRDIVSSPSFTLSNVYTGDNLTIHHYDFYRLHDAGIMKNELAESMQDEHVVTVVEWGNIVADVLPTNRLSIKITSTGEAARHFTFMASKELTYLVEALRG